MSSLSFFILFFLFPACSRVDALFGHAMIRCQFTSSSVVYQEEYYFNKVLLGLYNNTLGKWIGFTEKAVEIAEQLNKNPSLLKQMKKNANRCISTIPVARDILLKPAKPHVRLRSVEASSSKRPGIIICSVYNFYPKQIRVTWLRNGKEVTSDVTSTEEMPNGNWFYQVHSHLEYAPKHGEKITCMVEHASLTEPKYYDWEPIDVTYRNKIAVGAAGLVLGLVFSVAGLIYYKKSSGTGRILVPTHNTQ